MAKLEMSVKTLVLQNMKISYPGAIDGNPAGALKGGYHGVAEAFPWAVEAHRGAVEAHPGAVKAHSGVPESHFQDNVSHPGADHYLSYPLVAIR